ncbi:TPA: YdcP family protein [Clostridioides difficile]|nr:YdcP family protein [Clostridioides difficile]
MELKFVVPNMEKTFGNLEYAGESKVVQRRINGRITAVSRSYNLYSDIQRADDIIVVLPAEAGEKHFQPEQKVKLINPRITAEGYKIGTRGFTNYILLADDMLPAENK